MDNLTKARKVKGTFDFWVDYGTLDDLSSQDRSLYVSDVLPFTRHGSLFLLRCFEQRMHWWERVLTRLLPFGALALEPGEAERHFGKYFKIERIAGEAKLTDWPWGFAAYPMTSKTAQHEQSLVLLRHHTI